jgi:mono/diheme cytochrome c family protein
MTLVATKFLNTAARALVAVALILLWLPVHAFAQRGGGRGAQQEQQAAPAAVFANAPAGNADNGKKLWNSVGCYQCHGYSAQGGAAGARLAPNPPAFAALVMYVRSPKGEMPPYTSKVISEAQLADIYAYLKSIPKPPDVKSIPLLNKTD